MTKKYIRYLLKEWLPIILVGFFLLITPTLIGSITTSFQGYYYEESLPTNPTMLPLLTELIVSATSFAALFAFFIESYRFKKRNADCFYSLPFKPGQLRRIRTFLALGILLVLFTLAFWIPTGIYFIRYSTTDIVTNPDSHIMKQVMIDPLWLFGGYLVTSVYLSMSLFLSSFLVRLGNSVLSSAIILAAGCAFLGGFFPALSLYTLCGLGDLSRGGDILKITCHTYGLSSPVYYFGTVFAETAINGGVIHEKSVLYSVLNDSSLAASFFLSMAIAFLLGVGSLVGLLLLKDPSGEYSGVPGSHFKYASLIVASLFLPIILLIGCLGAIESNGADGILSVALYIGLFVMLGAFQYIVYLLFEKKPKLSRVSWILVASIQVLSIILFFVI